MAKKPNIRFAGFEDDWEQRKLGEIAIEILAGGDIDKEKVVDDGAYPIYANALTNDGIVGYYNDYYRVKAPAVTVTGRGEVGHAQARMTDFTPVVRLLAIRSSNDCYFLENAINNHKVVVESTGVPQLTVPQLSSYDICFPKDIEEEKKIGAYYKKLDRLITLHQRKCDELKKVKKFMLQKMFPKKGEKNPEIRFDGFTNDWEQRKLGEVCSEIGDGLHSAPKYNDNGEVFFINGNNLVDGHIVIDPLKTRRVSKETFEKNNKHLDNNTLLLSINGTIGNLAYYQGEQVMLGKSIAYLKVNGIDHFFLYTSLQTAEILNSFMISLTGTTIKNLGLEAIKNTIIAVPKLEEQHKIGVYFSALDHLITLHQCKCKSCKKYYKCTRKLKCWYLIEEKFIFVIINIRVTDNKFYL